MPEFVEIYDPKLIDENDRAIPTSPAEIPEEQTKRYKIQELKTTLQNSFVEKNAPIPRDISDTELFDIIPTHHNLDDKTNAISETFENIALLYEKRSRRKLRYRDLAKISAFEQIVSNHSKMEKVSKALGVRQGQPDYFSFRRNKEELEIYKLTEVKMSPEGSAHAKTHLNRTHNFLRTLLEVAKLEPEKLSEVLSNYEITILRNVNLAQNIEGVVVLPKYIEPKFTNIDTEIPIKTQHTKARVGDVTKLYTIIKKHYR